MVTLKRSAVYLGQSVDGEHVYAEIEIQQGTGSTTYTDHSVGTYPETLSIQFVTATRRAYALDNLADREVTSWGQVEPAHRRIITDNPHVKAIEVAWADHHLNTLKAACDHMTPEMLEAREDESVSDWQKRMLDETVCPETGYRWGRAWLSTRVPDEILAEVIAAVEALPAVRS